MAELNREGKRVQIEKTTGRAQINDDAQKTSQTVSTGQAHRTGHTHGNGQMHKTGEAHGNGQVQVHVNGQAYRTDKAYKTDRADKAHKTDKVQKPGKLAFIAVGVIAVLIAGFYIFRPGSGGTDAGTVSGDLIIPKSEVTEIVKYYPYKVGKTRMEVLAVKAGDGTIRTAFNTCQVCFDSGRGYYEQEGYELVCQNCGNRFPLDEIGLTRGGCNPVPVLKEIKIEDEEKIVIPQEFLAEYKVLFANWKK